MFSPEQFIIVFKKSETFQNNKQNKLRKKLFFVGILKVTDEKSRIWGRIR